MQKVRRSRTNIEEEVAKILRVEGLAYRRNVRTLPGSPDFANRKRGWAIFVNGCFWHFHEDCSLAKLPKSNREFWEEKRRANRERDARKVRQLIELGLEVLTVWQCDLDDPEAVRARLSKLGKPRGI